MSGPQALGGGASSSVAPAGTDGPGGAVRERRPIEIALIPNGPPRWRPSAFPELLRKAEEFEKEAGAQVSRPRPPADPLRQWLSSSPCPLGDCTHRILQQVALPKAPSRDGPEDGPAEPSEDARPSSGRVLAVELESALVELSTKWQASGTVTAFKLSGRPPVGLDQWTRDLRDRGANVALTLNDFSDGAVELDLRDNRIGCLEAEQLSELANAFRDDESVVTLCLTSNSIGDRAIGWLRSALLSNASLTEVVLSHNQIGDDGAAGLSVVLERKATLTTLHLGSNCIGSKGAMRLSAALKKNRSLKELDLGCNAIGDDGAAKLCEALSDSRSLCGLVELNLSGNRVGEQGLEQLNAALARRGTADPGRLEAARAPRFVVECSPQGTRLAGSAG